MGLNDTYKPSKSGIKKVLIIILIVNIILGLYYDQKFVCDKAKNLCYSTIAGIQISKSTKINEIQSLKIVYLESHYFDRYGNQTDYSYMPTLTTNQNQEIPFYKSPSKSNNFSQQCIADFINFLHSNNRSFELKNNYTNLGTLRFLSTIVILGWYIRGLNF